MGNKYEIRLFYMGHVYKNIFPIDLKSAKRKYLVLSNSIDHYVQLLVNGEPLTTAQAEKFLIKQPRIEVELT